MTLASHYYDITPHYYYIIDIIHYIDIDIIIDIDITLTLLNITLHYWHYFHYIDITLLHYWLAIT
jgi:hypothetical protein